MCLITLKCGGAEVRTVIDCLPFVMKNRTKENLVVPEVPILDIPENSHTPEKTL